MKFELLASGSKTVNVMDKYMIWDAIHCNVFMNFNTFFL